MYVEKFFVIVMGLSLLCASLSRNFWMREYLLYFPVSAFPVVVRCVLGRQLVFVVHRPLHLRNQTWRATLDEPHYESIIPPGSNVHGEIPDLRPYCGAGMENYFGSSVLFWGVTLFHKWIQIIRIWKLDWGQLWHWWAPSPPNLLAFPSSYSSILTQAWLMWH